MGVRKSLLIHDVHRAYFYAKQTRNIFIELPKEDGDAKEGEIGQLLLCLYGTRDAAKEWQKTLSENLRKNGFVAGAGHPSVFYNAEKDIRTLVHGDDYFSCGRPEQLKWLEERLGEAYEIQTQRIGGGDDSEREGDIF